MNIQDKKILLIGGGTGNSQLLRTLKKFTENITSIVTVADDGGSSGFIRKDMGLLPPGDIRNCIIALADEEAVVRELMCHRFKTGSLKNQNFGNLLIAALNEMYGNFGDAVRNASEILAIKGRVLPVTLENVALSAVLENGKRIKGESKIHKGVKKHKSPVLKMQMHPEHVKAYPYCIEAIKKADVIVYTPGSLYTSLIPNFLVSGIVDALERAKAKRFYVVNIMTEMGETDGYGVAQHIQAIERHTDGRKIIDTVIYNTEDVTGTVLQEYRAENAELVSTVIPENIHKEYELCGLDLVEMTDGAVRHDGDVLWSKIFELSQ